MNADADERVPLPEGATLRQQLLISLLAPIVLVMLISAVVTYYYAYNFATLAYDYSLFDSALDISRQTRSSDGTLHVDLPSAALDMLESDTHDSIYYMINDARGAFVAGHRGIPLPTDEVHAGKPVYYDGNYRQSDPDRRPARNRRRCAGRAAGADTGRRNAQQAPHAGQ